MTPEGLLRRYYALRTDPDRRKLDTLIEEAAKALAAPLSAPVCKPLPSGCPPHLVAPGTSCCVNCSWKVGDQ